MLFARAGKRTGFDAPHFLFPHGRQLYPHNLLHVYLWRVDRGEFEYRVGHVFGVVDRAANGPGRTDAAGGREGDDNEVHAAVLSVRCWLLSCVLGDVHRGTPPLRYSCEYYIFSKVLFNISIPVNFITQIFIPLWRKFFPNPLYTKSKIENKILNCEIICTIVVAAYEFDIVIFHPHEGIIQG